MGKLFYRLWYILIALMLASCGGTSSSPGNNGAPGTSLGPLPNGSTVWVSQGSFTTPSNSFTSGTIGLSGGSAGQSYTLSFSISPTGPGVTSTPTTCTIVSGSSSVCQLMFSGNNSATGTYIVTVSYIQNGSGSATPLPGTITLIVTGGGNIPESGTLVISPLAESSISIGESTTATVTLSGSQNITTPVVVNIINNNSSVVSESNTPCNLTTASNNCTVTLTGIAPGQATFTAAVPAGGYVSQTSESVTVTVPGTINVTTQLLPINTQVIQGESFNVVVTLGESNVSPQTITVSNQSALEADGIMVFNESSGADTCILQTAIAPYAESCIFIAIPVWNSATPNNSYMIMLSNAGSITWESNVNFGVYSPAVYLPQTGESANVGGTAVPLGLDGNPIIGESWPNPRFTTTNYSNSGTGNSETCVTDNLTGLMWVSNIKDTDLNSITGTAMHFGTSGGTGNTVLAAIASVNGLGGVGYCGHDDWRLPNLNELLSLINYGQTNPATWLNNSGFFTNVQAYYYWSSSLYAPVPTNGAWAVYFTNGSTTAGAQTGYYDFVWPVRAGQ